jgi:hypothetical protein
MTAERAHAYRRVTHTLSELGPSKLLSGEQERIRKAADSLLFCPALDDADAREGLADIEALCRSLVESGRWERATAMRLVHDISACGPPAAPVELKAA